MTLQEIAAELIAANMENRTAGLLDQHYSPDCISVEAAEMPGGREAVGLDAIRAKHAWWEENMEFLSGTIEGPYFHGEDRFAVVFKSSVKERASGTVTEMEEVALYTVAGGKVVREEFFYEV